MTTETWPRTPGQGWRRWRFIRRIPVFHHIVTGKYLALIPDEGGLGPTWQEFDTPAALENFLDKRTPTSQPLAVCIIPQNISVAGQGMSLEYRQVVYDERRGLWKDATTTEVIHWGALPTDAEYQRLRTLQAEYTRLRESMEEISAEWFRLSQDVARPNGNDYLADLRSAKLDVSRET